MITAVGLLGTIKMEKYKIVVHGMLTSGIFSVLFIYFILEGLFSPNLRHVILFTKPI